MPQLSLYAIAALIVTNLLTCGLWYVASSELDMLKLRGQVAQEHADGVVRTQKQITEDTAHAWNANLVALRADYERRLRHARAGQMPGLSQPPARIDAIPADALPLAGQCAETTLQLVQLQGWISRQEMNK